MSTEFRIQTAEGISFSFQLAGPVTRLLAWVVDAAAVSVAGTMAGTLLKLTSIISVDLSRALILLSYFVLMIGYSIGMEWFWQGQTLGKRLLHLRVIDENGLKLQFNQIVIRNLLRFVDMLPLFYAVGGIACSLSRRSQRLGDFAANTLVIRHLNLPEPDLDQLAFGKFNSLLSHPHLCARLRQIITPPEAHIALQALMRRDELDPTARIALFGDLAARFKSAVAFPPESIETLSDEQYVRNVTQVLFQSSKPAGASLRPPKNPPVQEAARQLD